MRTGELGYWWRALGGPPPARAALTGPAEADVVIVGAGYTGLWTAYYLARARPSLRIIVLEREVAGFGASGRNGGWVSGFFSGPPRAYEARARGRLRARGQARPGGREAAHGGGYAALQRAMFETVDEVGRVLAAHGIEADFLKHGQLEVALGEAQLRRLRERLALARAHGVGERDLCELTAAQTRSRVRVAGALGALYSPHVARVQPARLLVGLAAAVEAMGVRIHEHTRVLEVRPGAALTAAGTVRARWVVRATEGYTATLRGQRRALVPMNSSMIVTEPLSPAQWAEIGWEGQELLSDAANAYVYLQRTVDGRIAIGGRGVPYRFGSRTDGRGSTAPATVRELRARLARLLAPAAGVGIEHAWSGVLGVPRDWCMAVAADPASGLARAGGYVGQGVAAANLAGRTLRDQILGAAGDELTSLPWVGRSPRRWEPEPLRWAAIRATYSLYRRADRIEAASGRPARLARLVDAATGRH